MTRRITPWIILIAVTTLLIWGQSLMPGRVSQAESDSFRAFVTGLLGEGFAGSFLYRHIRKAAHFTEFAVLGAEWQGLGQQTRPRTRRWLPWLGALTAIADEALQAITDRAPRLTDVLIDWAGFLTGGLLVMAAAALWRARRRRSRA